MRRNQFPKSKVSNTFKSSVKGSNSPALPSPILENSMVMDLLGTPGFPGSPWICYSACVERKASKACWQCCLLATPLGSAGTQSLAERLWEPS